MKKTNFSRTRYITCIAIMSAIATILMYFDFPLPMLIPGFIKFDFSELPALISSFALGPISGVIICFIKNLFHCIKTTTGCIGEMSNFILGASFVGTAGLFYKYKKNRLGALLGAVIGSLIMGGISMLSNYYLTYPIYTKFIPMQAIIGMYQAIYSGADSLWKCLAIFNLPFTIAKGLINAVISFLIYKPLSHIIKGTK